MTKEEYKKLKEKVLYHRNLYDNEKKEITDSAYDELFFTLKEMEEKYPELVDKDSPTQTVSSVLSEELRKFVHDYEMKSMDRVKHDDETGLRKFLDKYTLDKDSVYYTDKFCVEDKEDGLTIVNYYNRDGQDLISTTRGDGTVGEIVTPSISNLHKIPKKIAEDFSPVIRGEAVINYDDFDRVNKEGYYASPRNLASGSIRTLDKYVARDRNVRFLAYNVENAVEYGLKTEEEMFIQLEKWGFEYSNPVFFDNTEKGKEELIVYLQQYEEKYRGKLDHMIDGLVIKPNNLMNREKIGSTGHHFRWSLAYKFESEEAVTTVKEIYWTVGKTGMVVPSALVEPVEISSSIVQKASLANINNIWARDVREGDKVFIQRSNDVIPQIISSIEHTKDSKKVELPENCPSCNAPLEVVESIVDGEVLTVPYCRNKDCEAQNLRKLENFASKQAMDIDTLGGKTLEILYQENLIGTFSDIYLLKEHEEKLLKLDRFGKKKVEKLLAKIEESKEKGLYNVLVGISVKNIGKDVSKKLSLLFGSFAEMKKQYDDDKVVFSEKLENIEGFGDIIVQTILHKLLGDEEVLLELSKLEENGVSLINTLKEVVVSSSANDLSGKTFVISGSFSKSRKELKEEIEKLGGKVTGSISASTNYLVFGGENKRGKYEKAEKLGIQIVGEDFIK